MKLRTRRLIATFGHEETSVRTEVIHDRPKGQDLLLGDGFPPRLALDDPKYVDPLVHTPHNHVDVVIRAYAFALNVGFGV